MVAAEPSCSSGRRKRSPHSAGVRISLGSRGALRDAVAGADVVQQQIGEERHGCAIEQRVARSGRSSAPGVWHARAADGAEDRSPCRAASSIGPAADGREEAHEAREVVDAAPAGARIRDVLGIGDRIADAHPLRRDADRHFRSGTGRW